jgi:diacylglycerol kinase (ATP)
MPPFIGAVCTQCPNLVKKRLVLRNESSLRYVLPHYRFYNDPFDSIFFNKKTGLSNWIFDFVLLQNPDDSIHGFSPVTSSDGFSTSRHASSKSSSMPKFLLRFTHAWQEGTLPLTAMCFVCNAPIMFYDGCECVRCENTAHTDCLSLSEVCKPRHRHLIFVEEMDMPPTGDLARKTVLDEGESGKRSPLLVLINSRSGGNLGASLAKLFCDLLTPEQVVVIDQEGPMPTLKKFCKVKDLRILACGGDGTIGWIMNCIDELRQIGKKDGTNAFAVYPPVAILPLGTGNDLARTLGWGKSYDGSSVSNVLNQIQLSSAVHLDRWKIKVSPHRTAKGKKNESGEAFKPTKEYEIIMNNYFSVGIDAQVCLDFHETRKENPDLFASQLVNRLWYFTFGTKALVSDLEKLNEIIELYVDGKRVVLPPGAGGLLILNIRHYGGGADFWGQSSITGNVDADFPQPINGGDSDQQTKPVLTPPRLDDGLLEVCCVWSSFHLAQISVQLSRAKRLVQGRHIKIRFVKDVPFPVQMDGEPSKVSGVDLEITHHTVASMLVPMIK